MKLTNIIDEEYSKTEERHTDSIKGISIPTNILDAYKKYQNTLLTNDIRNAFSSTRDRNFFCYNFAKDLARTCSYEAENITQFSYFLSFGESSFVRKKYCGYFLSAFINSDYIATKRKEAYILQLENYPLNNLAHQTDGANIKIIGNVLHYVCQEMKGGTVLIEGNSEQCSGFCMQGGLLQITGNVGSFIGLDMEGGTIIVEGNTASELGRKMSGGTIIVNGTIDPFPTNSLGGEIYCKGKLLYKDGQRMYT